MISPQPVFTYDNAFYQKRRHLDLEKYLVISALGHDQPGIVDGLSRVILDCQCNIVDSRMSVLGGEFAVVLLATAPTAQKIEALKAELHGLQKTLGLTIISKETVARAACPGQITYDVSAVAIDHPGIVHQLAKFFSCKGINIENLGTDCYAAAHTGTPMFAIKMQINVPSDQNITEIQTQFLDFCDDLNIDATLDPHQTDSDG